MRLRKRFLVGADGEPRVWWNWQNLDRVPAGDREVVVGRGWKHGRAWLHVGDANDYRRLVALRAEWVLGRVRLGASVAADEEGLGAHLSIPGVTVYVGAEHGPFDRLASWLLRGRYQRELALRVHDGAVWWLLWVDDSERSYPRRFRQRVRAGSFDPADALLGKPRYASTDLETREVEVPMPETTYRGVARLHQDEWRRPRWPRVLRVRRVTITMRDGEAIPHPGKGENDYDLDEDATYGLTTTADSIEEGIGHLVASVLRDRRRHGGADWRPAGVSA